jgi:DNA-binding transcriptional regulator YdaS (Cro superfamily)
MTIHPLTHYRQQTGMTQQALAVQLDTTRATINRWESGVRTITAEKSVEIETRTKGRISRAELRPDLFKKNARKTSTKSD